MADQTPSPHRIAVKQRAGRSRMVRVLTNDQTYDAAMLAVLIVTIAWKLLKAWL